MTQSGTRADFWERLEQFRDKRIRTPLIGHAVFSWLIAGAVAIITARFFQSEFSESYEALRTSLPAAMIAIVGFVIAALSILLSGSSSDKEASSRTKASFIADERPDGWRLIIRQVSGAAKLAGFLAILVAIEPVLRSIALNRLEAKWVDLGWLFLFTMLATLMVMNMLRVIWLLERTSAPMPQPKK